MFSYYDKADFLWYYDIKCQTASVTSSLNLSAQSVRSYRGHLLVYRCALQWRHNERDGVSNHQPHDCLLNGLFRFRSKKTSKLCVTGLCAGNSPGTGEFPAQRASNAENVSIWWRHHGLQMAQHLSMLGHQQAPLQAQCWSCLLWSFFYYWGYPWGDDAIQNDRRDLGKSRITSECYVYKLLVLGIE